jgi:hypothetical protein
MLLVIAYCSIECCAANPSIIKIQTHQLISASGDAEPIEAAGLDLERGMPSPMEGKVAVNLQQQ